jgi:hypothetical protein
MIERVYEISLNNGKLTNALNATRIYISFIENYEFNKDEIVL